jgi:hypothetical protein
MRSARVSSVQNPPHTSHYKTEIRAGGGSLLRYRGLPRSPILKGPRGPGKGGRGPGKGERGGDVG